MYIVLSAVAGDQTTMIRPLADTTSDHTNRVKIHLHLISSMSENNALRTVLDKGKFDPPKVGKRSGYYK